MELALLTSGRLSGRPLFMSFCVAASLSACAHAPGTATGGGGAGGAGGEAQGIPAVGLKPLDLKEPVLLRLKGEIGRPEKVSYVHRTRSTSYEDVQVRHQKEETLEFVSQADTLRLLPGRGANDETVFTQVLSIVSKNGTMSLHDFAMPEMGENLEVTADSRGRILRAGDYPSNSIFYVPPISLPDGPVHVGDTWGLQSEWLSLEEMVPYRLDMTSILRAVSSCGAHRCASIELSGQVTLQGPLSQVMAFSSFWKGYLMFDIDAGTVVWSRVDSEEQFASGNVRRSITSCLEATLTEPVDNRLQLAAHTPCANLSDPGDIAPAPANMK